MFQESVEKFVNAVWNANSASFFCAVLFIGGSAATALAQEVKEEPAELLLLRQKYQEKLAQVKEPVTNSYIAALGRYQDSLNQSGEVDAAFRVLRFKTEVAKWSASPNSKQPMTASKTAPNVSDADSNSSEEEGMFDLKNTRWTWEKPATEIRFFADEKATVFHPKLGSGRTPYIWKRKGPRKFLIYDQERTRPAYYFRILENNETGVYSVDGVGDAQGEVSKLARAEE